MLIGGHWHPLAAPLPMERFAHSVIRACQREESVAVLGTHKIALDPGKQLGMCRSRRVPPSAGGLGKVVCQGEEEDEPAVTRPISVVLADKGYIYVEKSALMLACGRKENQAFSRDAFCSEDGV